MSWPCTGNYCRTQTLTLLEQQGWHNDIMYVLTFSDLNKMAASGLLLELRVEHNAKFELAALLQLNDCQAVL